MIETLAAIYFAFAISFFLALPPFCYNGKIFWTELFAQLFMSTLWPFFLTVAIFRRIIGS
jgi:hypothetical protein